MTFRLIAHRGNFLGRNEDRENSPEYVDLAINYGFDAEIDLWLHEGRYFLGHDLGEFPISLDYLYDRKERLWIHCKDSESFRALLDTDLHYFAHDRDSHARTSMGFIWSSAGNYIFHRREVLVMPEKARGEEINEQKLEEVAGVCSDFLLKYKAMKTT